MTAPACTMSGSGVCAELALSVSTMLPVLARFWVAVSSLCGIMDDSRTDEMRFKLGETSAPPSGWQPMPPLPRGLREWH